MYARHVPHHLHTLPTCTLLKLMCQRAPALAGINRSPYRSLCGELTGDLTGEAVGLAVGGRLLGEASEGRVGVRASRRSYSWSI